MLISSYLHFYVLCIRFYQTIVDLFRRLLMYKYYKYIMFLNTAEQFDFYYVDRTKYTIYLLKFIHFWEIQKI